MAEWIILRDDEPGRDKVRVIYLNLVTGVEHPLGKESSDTTDERIVHWIFNDPEAKPAYGDRFRLSNGKLLHFDRPRGEQA